MATKKSEKYIDNKWNQKLKGVVCSQDHTHGHTLQRAIPVSILYLSNYLTVLRKFNNYIFLYVNMGFTHNFLLYFLNVNMCYRYRYIHMKLTFYVVVCRDFVLFYGINDQMCFETHKVVILKYIKNDKKDQPIYVQRDYEEKASDWVE